MADESVDSVLTPEKYEGEVNIRKNRARHSVSPIRPMTQVRHLRASYHAGDSSSKNSNEKSGSSANGKGVVPHYLRASTGSCHEFCKHGKKPSFEPKARKPLRKKIATPLLIQHPVLIMDSGEKKEKAFNQISPTDTDKHSPDLDPSPEIIPYSPKPKKSLNEKKVVEKEPVKENHFLPDKKTYLRKSESTSFRKKPILVKSKPSPDPPEIVKSVFFLSKKDEDPVKQASSAVYKVPKAVKKTSFPSKKSSSLPVKPKPVKPKPFSSSSLDNSDSARGKGTNMPRNTTISKAPTKKVSAPRLPVTRTANSNSRTSGNVKSESRSKDENRIIRRVDKTKTTGNAKVPEKILHVIQTGSNNDAIKPVSSLPSPPSVNRNVIPEKKETPKKAKVVIPEDKKFRTPVTLKFRNGKVLDVQSNSNSARRLRFRRARVIGSDEGRSDLRRIIFKKSAVHIDDKSAEGTSREKVVLKHQEVKQGKKDGQGLLNNVIIEQTASKLVKSRKSKVKALVGAFETVISLQEKRPSQKAVGRGVE